MFGLMRSSLAIGGMMPFSRTRIVLIIPARPLHASRCPMFAFVAPLKHLLVL